MYIKVCPDSIDMFDQDHYQWFSTWVFLCSVGSRTWGWVWSALGFSLVWCYPWAFCFDLFPWKKTGKKENISSRRESKHWDYVPSPSELVLGTVPLVGGWQPPSGLSWGFSRCLSDVVPHMLLYLLSVVQASDPYRRGGSPKTFRDQDFGFCV